LVKNGIGASQPASISMHWPSPFNILFMVISYYFPTLGVSAPPLYRGDIVAVGEYCFNQANIRIQGNIIMMNIANYISEIV